MNSQCKNTGNYELYQDNTWKWRKKYFKVSKKVRRKYPSNKPTKLLIPVNVKEKTLFQVKIRQPVEFFNCIPTFWEIQIPKKKN